MTKIGIVGHRFFHNLEVSGFVAEQCYRLLVDFRFAYPDLTAISMLSEGADTIFAEAALDLCIPLEVIRPFRTYASDFTTPVARERYFRIRGMAINEITLGFENRSLKAYEAAMKLVVARSDLLVAAWDGRPAQGLGGTGHAVRYAVEIKRSWIHVDTMNLSVIRHLSDSPGRMSNPRIENCEIKTGP